jgi:hypothetical protein
MENYKLHLNPGNRFNGMSREDFKQMLISMGFTVEDFKGPGKIVFEDDKKNNADQIIRSVLPTSLCLKESNFQFDTSYQIDAYVKETLNNDYNYHYSDIGVSAA